MKIFLQAPIQVENRLTAMVLYDHTFTIVEKRKIVKLRRKTWS